MVERISLRRKKTYKGVYKQFSEWAEELDLPLRFVAQHGPEKALRIKGENKQKTSFIYKGKAYRAKDLGEQFGISGDKFKALVYHCMATYTVSKDQATEMTYLYNKINKTEKPKGRRNKAITIPELAEHFKYERKS